jgi:phospholipase A1/A2
VKFSPHSALVLRILLAGLLVVSAGPLAAAPAGPPQNTGSDTKEKKVSYWAELWHLDKEARSGRPWVTFHRSNAAQVFSYNASPNPAPLQEVDPAKALVKPEVTFQLSFKAKLWQDMFGKDIDLWVAYTQRSFWQLYNFDDSSPFRETDYEPEVLVNFRTSFRVLGLDVRFVQAGFNHQSNGQAEPLSRSWNRIVANIGLERGAFSLLLKGWYHLPEDPEIDDNPGINRYVGYGEIWGYYFLKGHRLGIMVRDNLDLRNNRGAIHLEWSFPLFAHMGGYVQYFLGYGESLLDFNHHINRIGVGFIFMDW